MPVARRAGSFPGLGWFPALGRFLALGRALRPLGCLIRGALPVQPSRSVAEQWRSAVAFCVCCHRLFSFSGSLPEHLSHPSIRRQKRTRARCRFAHGRAGYLFPVKGEPVRTTRGAGNRRPADCRLPLPRTLPNRKWKGWTLPVEVLADGFQFEIRRYTSLSAIGASGLYFDRDPRRGGWATRTTTGWRRNSGRTIVCHRLVTFAPPGRP